ncbi:RNA polymerase sigma factor [Pedobacter sp.]|uniref:RNA polymerase sigma factor n=1 Tax=Pedobacter sp. TaxID=1411316 RepID=UPI003C4CF652
MITKTEFDLQICPHLTDLSGFAFNFTRDTESANDLLQDTLIKAVEYFNGYQNGTNIRAWLFTIMRNTFINSFRKSAKEAKLILKTENMPSNILIKSAVENKSEGFFLLNDYKTALNSLPELFRLPFLKYLEGYKYREIADEMDIPIGTIKTRIYEARRILKTTLSDYDPAFHMPILKS